MNNNEMNNNKKLLCSSLALHDEVLLGGEDGLLCLVVSEVSSVEVGWSSALGSQHSGLGSSVGIESWPGQLLHSQLSSSGNVRDLQEAGDGVTVGIVGTGSSREAGRQLGGGQSHGDEREKDCGHHLGIEGWLFYTVAQSIFTDSTA